MNQKPGSRLSKMRAIVSSPAYATATTVLAVLAGLLGSVYQQDVATAFPLVWKGPWVGISWRAVGFWFSVTVFAVLFFFRQRSDDINRERLDKTAGKVEQGTSRIEHLVRTMPPKAFQTQLAQMIGAAHRGLSKTLPRQRRTEITDADLVAFIRSLLNSVARLALVYDDQPMAPDGAARYATNVMLYVPNPNGLWPEELRTRIRFCGDDVDLRQLKGVLELRADLSATSDVTEMPTGDDSVPTIALPLPMEPKRGIRWVALPGAPKAFLTDSIDGYDDAATLADWCVKSGDFRPSVVDELRHYFAEGDGKAIRSFISRPLHTQGGQPIGVLNLHSNQRDILGSFDQRMAEFQAMLTPIFLELESAIELLVAAEATRRSIASSGD